MTNLRTFFAPAGALWVLPADLSIFELAGRVKLEPSIRPRLRRDRLDVLRQRVHVHRSIVDARFARVVDPAQCVLLPVHVIAILEVLARVRAAALFAVLRGDNSRHRLAEQVVQLDRLDEIGVPDETAIRNAHVGERRMSLGKRIDTFLHGLPGAKHRGVALHDLLHFETDFGGAARTLGVAQAGRAAPPRNHRHPRERRVRLAGLDDRGGMAARFASEHDQIEQRIGAESIRTVHRYAGGLTHGHEAQAPRCPDCRSSP